MFRQLLTQIHPAVLLAILVGVLFAGTYALKSGLNTSFIPTPQDESSRIESSITKTADFAGTAFDQGSGFAPGGIGMPMAAVVKISALDLTDTNETYKLTLKESSDNITYTAAGPVVDVTATGVVSVPGFISKRYQKLDLDVGGTTPSITYEAWLNPLGAAT